MFLKTFICPICLLSLQKWVVPFFVLVILFSGVRVANGNSSDLKSLSLTGVNLSVRVILQGPYDRNSGLMSSQLQAQSLLPADQPYSAAPFNYSGVEQLSASVLSASGQDTVVDWVLLKLHDDTQRAVVAQKAVALQRDGDLVNAATGETALNFPTVSEGSYFISVEHRNHQGAATLNAPYLATSVTLVDFSSPDVPVDGGNARIVIDGFAVLRTGDSNQDGRLIAVGIGNDSNPLLSGILLADGNAGFNTSFQQQGYLATDFNLDGRAVYSGPSNDNNYLLNNVLLHPGNTDFAFNFIVNASAGL